MGPPAGASSGPSPSREVARPGRRRRMGWPDTGYRRTRGWCAGRARRRWGHPACDNSGTCRVCCSRLPGTASSAPCAGVAHGGNLERGVGDLRVRRFAVLRHPEGGTRAEPGRDDPVRIRDHHVTRPGAATGMAPEAPGNRGQLGMLRLLREVAERLEEPGARAVARVAPFHAVLTIFLLVRGPEQGTVPLPRERLPVQIVGGRHPPLARPGPAPVLMHDHPAELLHPVGNPHAIRHAVDQLSRLLGRRIMNLHDPPAPLGRPDPEHQQEKEPRSHADLEVPLDHRRSDRSPAVPMEPHATSLRPRRARGKVVPDWR